MATAEQTVSAVLDFVGASPLVLSVGDLDTDGYTIEKYANGKMVITGKSGAGTASADTLHVTFPEAFASQPAVFLQRVTSLYSNSANANYYYFVPRNVTSTGFDRANDSESEYNYIAIGRCA